MTQESKFRYYKCEGEALDLLKSYKIELEALIDGRQTLEQEYIERVQILQDYHQANLRIMWRRLAAAVGLDPDKTWGSPEYQVEARYLEDGFGALLYIPRTQNPLREVLGDSPETELENPEKDLPSKDVTKH